MRLRTSATRSPARTSRSPTTTVIAGDPASSRHDDRRTLPGRKCPRRSGSYAQEEVARSWCCPVSCATRKSPLALITLPPDVLPAFLTRFDEAYRPEGLSEIMQVVAFAASHHRFSWIHPFLDGNGRVTRLMTVAYARRIGLDAGGLWSIARGFARFHKEYYAALAIADEHRRSDFDGRGALSPRQMNNLPCIHN